MKTAYKLNTTTRDTVTASDLVKGTGTAKKETKHKTLLMAQIDHKAIHAEAYSQVIENAEHEESFIPEVDAHNGVIKATAEQTKAMEELTAKIEAQAEKTLIKTIEEASKYNNLMTATQWTSEDGRTTIKTKYFFDADLGIIAKELKTTPTRETFTVFIPTVRGLAGLRANMLEEDTYEAFQEIHNNHALLINGIEPEEHIFREIAEQDENDNRRKFYASQDKTIFINFYDGLITAVKNDRETNKAQKAQKIERAF